MEENDGDCDQSGVIRIHEDFKDHPRIAELTLLHEMIHHALFLENYQLDHGYRFGEEVNRIWRMGLYERLV